MKIRDIIDCVNIDQEDITGLFLACSDNGRILHFNRDEQELVNKMYNSVKTLMKNYSTDRFLFLPYDDTKTKNVGYVIGLQNGSETSSHYISIGKCQILDNEHYRKYFERTFIDIVRRRNNN